uniref:WGS project CAEQ00000000 data, annotated contig 1108 n=1 Tax=Trypanosoma congolense (strain IL3000) TaxID=1068625 RepID=F9W3T8_TRYCI|nr:unnamed protein product [Trypanosoma congolense IL3000]
MQDMNAKPDATQRGVDDGALEGVAASLSRPVGSGCGTLFFPSEDNNSARREECRRVAEINKVAAQEAEKRRMEETANRIEIEKLASLEAERMGREEKEKHAADKRKKKQELFSTIARNSARNKKGKTEMNVSNGGREDFFLHTAHEKDEEIRCKRVQDFYKSAREEMIANQKAKLEAKKREKEEDRRLVQEAVTAANLLIEEKRRIAKKNKESYEASLRAQILSKTKGVTRSSPAARPGPEVRHLYRCPVTRELLPPQEFTVVRPRRSSFCF